MPWAGRIRTRVFASSKCGLNRDAVLVPVAGVGAFAVGDEELLALAAVVVPAGPTAFRATLDKEALGVHLTVEIHALGAAGVGWGFFPEIGQAIEEIDRGGVFQRVTVDVSQFNIRKTYQPRAAWFWFIASLVAHRPLLRERYAAGKARPR